MKITFLGAAQTVTGSQALVQLESSNILVDCGMFQGLKELRLRNRAPFAFNPAQLDLVLLTHGHLDHCGLLPKLVAEGFHGPIYCSAPTKDVATLILSDSAKIQEEEADLANRHGYSKHNPATPLYTVADAQRVFSLFRTVEPGQEVDLGNGFQAVFSNSGHILGACSIALSANGKTILFSGDLGQEDDFLMYRPSAAKKADLVVMESTYGDRLHPEENPRVMLEAAVGNALRSGGTVIIPAFAVGRAQTLMYLLWTLRMEDRLPKVPFILDTPMGANMLSIMDAHRSWHKLTPDEFGAMCRMFSLNVGYAETIETIFDKRPKIVIAASGMLTGGRVLAYLERYLSEPETCILLIGYQAEGTRGRQLLQGERELKIRGKYYEVRANVVSIDGLSAHGDSKDLLRWLRENEVVGRKVCLLHGELSAAQELSKKINAEFGYETFIPSTGEVMSI